MDSHVAKLPVDDGDRPACFHCGQAVSEPGRYECLIKGRREQLCCAGCQAVAQTIVENNLEEFYQYRDAQTLRSPGEMVPRALAESLYDRPAIRPRYVRALNRNTDETTLMLEGLNCAACAWLIEKQLTKQPGILAVEVNYANMLATVKWQNDQIALSRILSSIDEIGYLATPYEPRAQYRQLVKQQTKQLKRIGITAALGMQIMIISAALYFGYFSGIEDNWRTLFQRVGLLLTLPIIFYSALPFFNASITQIKHGQPGMDVPVCLGLTLALLASIWTIITDQGEVYFDSIAMFVFLLLIARYFMHDSLLKASHNIERLVAHTPLSASRLMEQSINSMAETITAEELEPGDWIRVLNGHVIPADGVVVHGRSSVNQAVISGESRPIKVGPGSEVIAGSVNNDTALVIKVTASGENTVFSAIAKLTRQSLTSPTTHLPLIDYIARWFVVGILLIAASVAVYWWHKDPQQWLAVTVAVLVISCPCALSLAVPTAHASAMSSLMGRGVLLTDTKVFDLLPRIDHLLLDKTGTLTDERLQLARIVRRANLNKNEVLRLAASLEVNADHVIAKAILAQNHQPLFKLSSWENHPGLGISAIIDATTYYLGSADFIAPHCPDYRHQSHLNSVVYLANSKQILAELHFSHSLRHGVSEFVEFARQRHLALVMLTGDAEAPARALANQLKITTLHYACKPKDKLAIVDRLQRDNARVLMVGDGVNDSPVLARADVSIAVAGATPLAVSGADIVMVNPSLAVINELLRCADKTTRVIRQNISWAIGYNLLAVPFAAAGYINPLFAAIGMSLSSIIVVVNAQRLRR